MNRFSKTTIQAKADYDRDGPQYHAFALVDGQLANSVGEATGILISKPKTNEFAAIAYEGEIKFAAGGAVWKGDKLTVVNSGWFTSASSDESIVGQAKENVTSGSIGTGLFSFSSVRGNLNHVRLSVTPADDLLAGTAIAFNDYAVANSGDDADAVAINAMTAGTAADMVIYGIIDVKMDATECSSKGDILTVTTSGYFIKAGTGKRMSAKALENISSDSLGSALFFGSQAGQMS
jgi:hypothetical protein